MVQKLFDHWSDVPDGAWPCIYFRPDEIACKGTGELLLNPGALNALDKFRSLIGGPVSLSSAYRSAYHNAKVGGSLLSVHTAKGGASAFDVQLLGRDKETIRRVAEQCGFKGFGLRYKTFVHMDMGRRRTW
jgi:uncharacterized protein YcbK (DUF882 family)